MKKIFYKLSPLLITTPMILVSALLMSADVQQNTSQPSIKSVTIDGILYNITGTSDNWIFTNQQTTIINKNLSNKKHFGIDYIIKDNLDKTKTLYTKNANQKTQYSGDIQTTTVKNKNFLFHTLEISTPDYVLIDYFNIYYIKYQFHTSPTFDLYLFTDPTKKIMKISNITKQFTIFPNNYLILNINDAECVYNMTTFKKVDASKKFIQINNIKYIEITISGKTILLYNFDNWTNEYKTISQKKVDGKDYLESTNVDGTKTLYTTDLKNKIENYTDDIKKITVDNTKLFMTTIGEENKFFDTDLVLKNIYQLEKYFDIKYISKNNDNKTNNLYLLSDSTKKIENYKTIEEKTLDTDKLLIVTFDTEIKLYNVDLKQSTLYKTTKPPNTDYIEKTIDNVKTLYTMDGTNSITNYTSIKKRIFEFKQQNSILESDLTINYLETTDKDENKTLYTADLKVKTKSYIGEITQQTKLF